MAQAPADPYVEPEASIRCYERWSGLSVCIHDLEGRIGTYLPQTRHWHMTERCQAMKRMNDRCFRWDATIAHATARDHPQGAVRRCHAGLVELTAPIMDADRVGAILFAGQRTAAPSLAIDAEDDLATDLDDRSAGISPPPRMGQEEAAHLLEGLRQLGARLACWRDQVLGAHAPGRAPPPRDRRQAVMAYIADQHHRGIGLADLAARLGLSRHRTAHAVREACGRSFIDLLTEARLRTACAMLAHTAAPIGEVASRSGFGDPDHFHRVFRARLGTTPGAYRRQPTRGA